MLGKADWDLLSRQIQVLYQVSDLEAFPARVLDAMAPLISTDISCVTQVAPSRNWAHNVSDRPDDEVTALMPLLATYQHQHPRLVDYLEKGREDARTISDYVDRKTWHHSDLYNAFYRPLGLEDQLCVVFPATDEIAMSVVSNRTRRAFTARDRALLDALLPHIKTAYDNARAFDHLSEDVKTLSEVSGHAYLRVSRDGRILHAGPRARSFLHDVLRPREPVGDRLTGPLAAWVRAQGERSTPDVICRKTEVEGATGTLCLSLVASATDATWLLVLQHVPRQEPRALDQKVAALPARSRDVLRRLLSGDGEKQVAAKLEISKHTVHDHVKLIHRHFGVSARSELLALFIQGACASARE